MSIQGKIFEVKVIFKDGTCHRYDNVIDITILEDCVEITYILQFYTREDTTTKCKYTKSVIKNLKIEWR